MLLFNKVIFQFRIFPRKPWDWESCRESVRKVTKLWDTQQNCESWQACLIWHFVSKPVCSRKKLCIKWALRHCLRCLLKFYKFHCTCLTPFALTIDMERYEIGHLFKRTRMDWSFFLLISPIKHQGQCFPLLLTYPSAKFRISIPNRFSKTCDVNIRSCKFLRQIFHLKKLA